MILHNEKYSVLSAVETAPPLEQYDTVHNTENISTDDFYMARVFQITRSDSSSRKIALIDRICAECQPHAALHGNILTTILFSAIVRIDMDTGAIVQYQDCENSGSLLELHPIDGGYVIRGEGDLFRYDLSLKPVWHFTGRDIFASSHGSHSFRIKDGLIHCSDFSGWHYVLDLDGNLIRQDHDLSTP